MIIMLTNNNPCIFCLDEQKNPRCLPCGHSFCSDCLDRYLQVRCDFRCPLCRRGFQVSAGVPAEASNVRNTDLETHIIAANMSAPESTQREENAHATDLVHLFDIDILNDTLMLTLTEQETRLFADLYGEVLREEQRQASVLEATDTLIRKGMLGT